MIQILLFALFPIALAQYGHGYGHGGDNGHGYEQHYAPQPYKFGYDVKDHYGSTLQQKEEGDAHGNKRGSYGYTDGHGIYRQVDYVADKNGFRATIKTNEPGTSDEDPADVHIESNAPKTEYHSAPYKSQSYSHPSYQSYSAPSYSRHDSYSNDNHGYSSGGYGGYGDNDGYKVVSRGYGGNGGYDRSHSIPAVYYAKGY
jgi:hypothetical protein